MPWVLLGTRFAGRYHSFSLSPRPSPTLGRGTHPLTQTGKRTGGAARSLSWAAYGGGAARRDALSIALGKEHDSPSRIIVRGDGTVACLSCTWASLCTGSLPAYIPPRPPPNPQWVRGGRSIAPGPHASPPQVWWTWGVKVATRRRMGSGLASSFPRLCSRMAGPRGFS